MRKIIKQAPCSHCQILFFVTTKRPNQKYCSKKCVWNSKKTGKIVICNYCRKKIYRRIGTPYHIFYCDRKCQRHGQQKKVKRLTCVVCNKLLGYHKYKYCSLQCQQRERKQTTAKLIESGQYKYNSSKTLRKYLLEKRGRKCEYCNLEIWMDKPIPLEIEHVDGNSENNNLNNIKLICPNCHSQTPTYKGKNRGNGRFFRRQRYKKGLSY
jgi:hypothetical protein